MMRNSALSMLLALCLLLSLLLSVLAASAATDGRGTAARMEALVQQWVSLERQADQLQHSWQIQQLVLQQRLDLLQAERAALEQQLQQYSGTRNKTEQHRAELAQEQTRLEQQQQKVSAALQQIEYLIEELLPRLPEPLSQHWQKTLRKLELSKEAESNSQRLDVYLSLMKSFDDFEQKVTRHQTLMNLNGVEVLVDQIYLGTGQGWYLSRNGDYAGIGLARQEGWVWQEDNHLAGQLKRVLETLANPEKAQLRSIPVILLQESRP